MDKKEFLERVLINIEENHSHDLMFDELDYICDFLQSKNLKITPDILLNDSRYYCISSGLGSTMDWYNNKVGSLYVSKDKLFLEFSHSGEKFNFSLLYNDDKNLYERTIEYEKTKDVIINGSLQESKALKIVESKEFLSEENGVEYSASSLKELSDFSGDYETSTLTCSLNQDPTSGVVAVFKINSQKYGSAYGEAYSISNYRRLSDIIPKNIVYLDYVQGESIFKIERFIKSRLRDEELRYPRVAMTSSVEFYDIEKEPDDDDDEDFVHEELGENW